MKTLDEKIILLRKTAKIRINKSVKKEEKRKYKKKNKKYQKRSKKLFRNINLSPCQRPELLEKCQKRRGVTVQIFVFILAWRL